jgi:hypothetical protein
MMKSTLYFFGAAEAPSVSQANVSNNRIDSLALLMRLFSRNDRDSQAMISRGSSVWAAFHKKAPAPLPMRGCRSKERGGHWLPVGSLALV